MLFLLSTILDLRRKQSTLSINHAFCFSVVSITFTLTYLKEPWLLPLALRLARSLALNLALGLAAALALVRAPALSRSPGSLSRPGLLPWRKMALAGIRGGKRGR